MYSRRGVPGPGADGFQGAMGVCKSCIASIDDDGEPERTPRCQRCWVGVDSDGDGNCASCHKLPWIEAYRIRQAMREADMALRARFQERGWWLVTVVETHNCYALPIDFTDARREEFSSSEAAETWLGALDG